MVQALEENIIEPHAVNLVLTDAPLLSGELRACAQNPNKNNSTLPNDCSTGGVAAVQAYVKYYAQEQPTLVIPLGDFKSSLTIMSRFRFGVNLMVYNELDWRVWTVPAYTLWPDRFDDATLADAHEPLFPALVSNVVTSPIEPWHPYVKAIHFDDQTRLAVIYITKEYLENTHSQVDSTMQLLEYIDRRNTAKGCPESYYASRKTAIAAFSNIQFSQWFREERHQNQIINSTLHDVNEDYYAQGQMKIPPQTSQPSQCFLPAVVFDDKSKAQYDIFLDAFNNTKVQQVLPHLIVDLYGHLLSNGEETHVEKLPSPSGAPNSWIVSYKKSSTTYHQLRLSIGENNHQIDTVEVISDTLKSLPEPAMTSDYYQSLDNLQQYAREALETSLANEPGVITRRMPPQTSPDDGFRRCYVGECEVGNLFADALRWTDRSDVAMLPSFMFNGPGWEAGKIRTLEILENVPYSTIRCGGTMSGLSLLRILNYSFGTTSYGGHDSAKVGGRFLQVSGLKVAYNTDLEGDHVITTVEVYDRHLEEYLPLNRTRLYTFTSCSHLCFTFVGFPPLVGEEFLREEGERVAEVSSETDIKDDVKLYLQSEFAVDTTPYVPQVEGRIRKDTKASAALELEEQEDCIHGISYWDTSLLACVHCPSYHKVNFTKQQADLVGQAYSEKRLYDEAILTNGESFPISIMPEILALPNNIELLITELGESSSSNNTISIFSNSVSSSMVNKTYTLASKQSLHIEIAFDPSERIAGTDTSSLFFLVSEVSRSTGCPYYKMRYDVVAQLSLTSSNNYLGHVAAFGYTSAALIIVTSLAFAGWVHCRRKDRVVSTMQPFFLVTLCVGVLLIGSALIPLSIDDGVTSDWGCNVACMAWPWLLSVGFTVSAAALFSKLWRINKIFNSQRFQKVQIRERDVILPTVVLVIVNISLMLAWTFVDPITWERVEVEGQPWNSYGRCSLSDHIFGKAMHGSVVALCLVMFLMTCWQAFVARNISSEFSESQYLGIAIFSWAQLLVVGVPVMFLVDEDNVVARYSVLVGLLIAICMSMLLVIFIPMLFSKPPRLNSLVSGLELGSMVETSARDKNLSVRRKLSAPIGSECSSADQILGNSSRSTYNQSRRGSSFTSNFDLAKIVYEHKEEPEEEPDPHNTINSNGGSATPPSTFLSVMDTEHAIIGNTKELDSAEPPSV